MSIKKRIILYGKMKKLYPHPIEVEAPSVAEALRFLTQLPELQGQVFPVKIKGIDHKIALYAETDMEEIHLLPRTQGSGGRGGFIQVLIAVVMIAIAIWQPQLIIAMGLSTSSVFLSAAMMLTGGLIQMLTPVPKAGEAGASSNIIGASENTVQIGTRIPLAYGINLLGGHYLSYNVDAQKEWRGSNLTGTNAISYVTQEIASPTPHVYAGTNASTENDFLSVYSGSATGSNGFFIEYDKTPAQVCILNGIFPQPTASPTNIPTSAWVG